MKKLLLVSIMFLLFPMVVEANISCQDGTTSPTCQDCHQGCCSHHGGCASNSSSEQYSNSETIEDTYEDDNENTFEDTSEEELDEDNYDESSDNDINEDTTEDSNSDILALLGVGAVSGGVGYEIAKRKK